MKTRIYTGGGWMPGRVVEICAESPVKIDEPIAQRVEGEVMNKKLFGAVAVVIVILVGLFYFAASKKASVQAVAPVAVETPKTPAVPPPAAAPATRGGDELAYMYGQKLFDIVLENDQAFRLGFSKAMDDFTKSHVAKDPELSKRRAELDADREKVITRRLVEAGKDPKSDTYIPGRCDQLKPLVCSEGRFEKKPPYAPDVKK